MNKWREKKTSEKKYKENETISKVQEEKKYSSL